MREPGVVFGRLGDLLEGRRATPPSTVPSRRCRVSSRFDWKRRRPGPGKGPLVTLARRSSVIAPRASIVSSIGFGGKIGFFAGVFSGHETLEGEEGLGVDDRLAGGTGHLAGDRDRGDHPRPLDFFADLGELADQRIALQGRVAEQGLGGPPRDAPGVAKADALPRQERRQVRDEDLVREHVVIRIR